MQDKFLADQRNPIEVRADAKFDTNDDFIEKISLISKNRFAIALNSGTSDCSLGFTRICNLVMAVSSLPIFNRSIDLGFF